jgi:hypothetical protein
MNTVDTRSASATVQKSPKRECLPCEIPALCRNNYYRGKLLTERDFTDEQRYAADKLRLHNIALHGWGVVCGLAVKPHPHCPHLRAIIEPGLAIDTCGREIRVLKAVEIELPAETKKKGQEKQADHEHYEGCGCGEVALDLYVCIRFVECESEYAPAPFDDCACGDSGMQANRLCDSFAIEVFREKPPFWDDATSHECAEGDCEDLYRETLSGCERHPFHCMPLAVIRNVEAGKAVEEEQIDNDVRRILPSVTLLDDVVQCILEKLPTKPVTHIETFSWSHGDTFHCHEFMNRFIGSEHHARGFDITFDSPVDAEAIDDRSFQAMVVFHPKDPSDGRRMEIAPAIVDKGPGPTTTRCSLRINDGYARHCLDGRTFDLYLTLRCNVIAGRSGLAVDGNLLATHTPGDFYRVEPPTGDGIPGGDFVSWISVRSGSHTS